MSIKVELATFFIALINFYCYNNYEKNNVKGKTNEKNNYRHF